MDIDTTRDEYRCFNQDGYYTVVQMQYDTAGILRGVRGPVYPVAADADGLRLQILKMAQALEGPYINQAWVDRVADDVEVTMGSGVPSREDDDVQNDGAFSDSSEVPAVRNSIEEEMTTRAAQAAQHQAEASGVLEPATAVSLVPDEADPQVLKDVAEEIVENLPDPVEPGEQDPNAPVEPNNADVDNPDKDHDGVADANEDQ